MVQTKGQKRGRGATKVPLAEWEMRAEKGKKAINIHSVSRVYHFLFAQGLWRVFWGKGWEKGVLGGRR